VASGESLSKISKHYFKDPMKYTAILEANRNILKNPDMIHPGQELIIPNL
jgi:nucleoid-associated protein YgaU